MNINIELFYVHSCKLTAAATTTTTSPIMIAAKTYRTNYDVTATMIVCDDKLTNISAIGANT